MAVPNAAAPQESEHRFSILMLGGLRVRYGSRELDRFRTRKAGMLLAYLALNSRRPQPREMALELLWPEMDPEAARHNLSQTLHTLRRSLQELSGTNDRLIVADHDNLTLERSLATSDVAEFDDLLLLADKHPEARRDRLVHAVSLYAGSLIPSCYEDWVFAERVRLESAYIRALKNLSSEEARRGELEHAIRYAQMATTADPLDEEARLILMRHFCATERYREAEGVYRDLKIAQHREIGGEPQPSTVLAVEEMLSGRSAAPFAVSLDAPRIEPRLPMTGLPRPLTTFVGREEQIRHLRRLLSNTAGDDTGGRSRLVTLTGLGGSGKTRLALEAARLHEIEGASPAYFVSLASLTDARELPAAIQQAVGGDPDAGTDPCQRIVDFFHSRPALLILDNFEHLLPGGMKLVADLLASVANLRCLVTSRIPLGISGEQEFPVPPLPVPGARARRHTRPELAAGQRLDVLTLLSNPSVALFVDRASDVRFDFEVTMDNARPIAALCDRLEGIPLAIELAAARIGTLSPADMLEQMEDRFGFLVRRERVQNEKHKALIEAVAWSYALLSAEEQEFFCRLAVFRGGWSLGAARAVTGNPRAFEILDHLRELALIQTRETGQEIRFSMLETIREFSVSLANEQGNIDAALRHAEWYLELVERSGTRLHDPLNKEVVAILDGEHENLRSALEWGVSSGRPDVSRGIALALGGFWTMRGFVAEGRRWFQSLLAGAEDAPLLMVAELHLCCGVFATRVTDVADAKYHIARSLSLYRQADDKVKVLKSEQALGDAHRFGGEHLQAIEHYQNCVALCEAAGDSADLANCNHGLGISCIYMGRNEDARRHLEIALELRQELGHALAVARTENLLGFTLAELNDLAGGEKLFRTCLAVLRDHGDRWYEASTLCGLADIAYAREELVDALSLSEMGLEILREVHSRESISNRLQRLGFIYIKMGMLEEAQCACRESLEISLQLENDHSVANAVECAANVAQLMGRLQEAATLLGATATIRKSLSITPIQIERTDNKRLRALLLATLGHEQAESAEQRGASLTPREAASLALATI